jgi:hypothetical protein
MLQRTSLWDMGAAKFDWWPDWRGQACAIVASGPSTKKANLGILRDRVKVIAIKENVDLCSPDVVYGCDAPWWKSRLGLWDFEGLKISYAQRLGGPYPNIKLISIKEKIHKILLDEPGVIGSGGNSGFQALNLAIQFGANRIMLIGFDMNDRSGVHWFGRTRGIGRNNPDHTNFTRWCEYFADASKLLPVAGVEVINCSPNSDLKCFRKASIETTLTEWQL